MGEAESPYKSREAPFMAFARASKTTDDSPKPCHLNERAGEEHERLPTGNVMPLMLLRAE
jgi:hypothetical protein